LGFLQAFVNSLEKSRNSNRRSRTVNTETWD
jgi:hypothetical protein